LSEIIKLIILIAAVPVALFSFYCAIASLASQIEDLEIEQPTTAGVRTTETLCDLPKAA